MYEHSTAIENLRQVTLTTDPDTENEETFSVQVPKGGWRSYLLTRRL
ncbi:MAG: hypothetical protein ACLTER_09695 [Ruminococcus sp.]